MKGLGGSCLLWCREAGKGAAGVLQAGEGGGLDRGEDGLQGVEGAKLGGFWREV